MVIPAFAGMTEVANAMLKYNRQVFLLRIPSGLVHSSIIS